MVLLQVCDPHTTRLTIFIYSTNSYPLDLVRTRLTTEFPGQENYKGITDALMKIIRSEGVMGLYSGIAPTLFVAIPNFAISYSVYGTLKEYVLDDELFYNMRKINDESGEESLGFRLTLLCGAASGIFSTLVTFPFDVSFCNDDERVFASNVIIPYRLLYDLT